MNSENIDFGLMMRILQGLQTDMAEVKNRLMRIEHTITEAEALRTRMLGVELSAVTDRERLDALAGRVERLEATVADLKHRLPPE